MHTIRFEKTNLNTSMVFTNQLEATSVRK